MEKNRAIVISISDLLLENGMIFEKCIQRKDGGGNENQ